MAGCGNLGSVMVKLLLTLVLLGLVSSAPRSPASKKRSLKMFGIPKIPTGVDSEESMAELNRDSIFRDKRVGPLGSFK